ncbi:MAG: endolytic transglycosylase MltG [Nitrospinota bacterium]
MIRRRKLALWGAIFGAAPAALGALWLIVLFHAPFRLRTEPKVVEFPRGTSVRGISAKLEEEGLIRSRHLFALWAWLRGQTRNLQAGEYRLSASMSPVKILDILLRGEVVQHPFTIPEGYTVREIAEAAEQVGIGSAGEIELLSRDPSFLRKFGIPAASAEGYLFPETYRFPRRATARKILGRMIATFRKRFTPEMLRRARQRNLSVHQVVTLASIIERETALPHERPLIAAVFQNRLRRGMRLQADPTVLYALNRTSGPLSRENLRVESPFNTYRIKGLPPGPIANPGLDSMLAALNPAPVDYLYFVARDDGGHEFSRTLRDHLKAVRTYRRKSVRDPEPLP